MSTLFEIRIESVHGKVLRARFAVCHPDQWQVPSSKTVGLLTIVEAYDDLRRRSSVDVQEPLAAALKLYKMSDAAAFTAAAEELILETHLEDEIGNPRNDDNDPHPQATLVVTVQDGELLAQLPVGFEFGSALCDCYLWGPPESPPEIVHKIKFGGYPEDQADRVLEIVTTELADDFRVFDVRWNGIEVSSVRQADFSDDAQFDAARVRIESVLRAHGFAEVWFGLILQQG